MKQRIADIVWNEIARHNVRHAFMLSGGGAMYLVDALGRSRIGYVCCHHEQASAVAAKAYSLYSNGLGVCLVTTGPGGTNALTACGAAYVDSTPLLFLSGQVKTADFASKRRVRQFGAQENDIVAMAKPVTKYAVLVERPEDALYELQKAIFLACHGRRGPVWVDIPLDVQSAEFEEDTLRRFDPATEAEALPDPTLAAQLRPDHERLGEDVAKILKQLAAARRPLILVGHGLIAAGRGVMFRDLTKRLGIPVVATWRALGIMDHDDPLFFGSPGLQAVRSANLITQGADFLLVLGSRLDNMITAFSESNFAYHAQKVIIDLDANEIAKLDMPAVTPVVADAGQFLDCLTDRLPARPTGDISKWLAFCAEMKERFPLLAEKQDTASDLVDLYQLADAVSSHCTADDAVVVTSTSRSNTAGHIAFRHQAGQRSISSMGFGSMGFALPSVVGAWFASGGKRVVMFDGDGSFQLNLQELQTITHHNINAKLFVFSNNGYAAIATMQDRNFAGRHVGSDPASGVTMPSLERIAAAYGIPYIRIGANASIAYGVRQVMDTPGPCICEAVGDIRFDEIPKCISSVNADGKRVSALLENPYPFLSESELAAIFDHFS